jgi:radical SAM PhpK family P-methyltransferase
MLSNTNLDCILVGYNDLDFNAFAAKQKEMESHSGAYHEIKSNSLILHGKRMTYMELLNHAITRATGQNPHLNVFEAPSLGVCYLKSYLQKRHFEVEIVNFFNYDLEKFKKLLSSQPRTVAITTTFYIDNAPIIEIVKFVRKHSPDTKIIVGGPHIFNLASDLDEETQEYVFDLIGADIYIIDSQGENTLGQVLRQLQNGQDLNRVPNLLYTSHDGVFHRTQRVVENNDMDENSVEWNFLDQNLIAPIAYLRTARSCPFVCAFCNYPAMAGAHILSSVDVIEHELKTLHEAGTQVLVFIDDTFNFPLDRFKQLLRMMIRHQFNFRWVSFLRCSNIDIEALDLIQESGCIGVLLGIESGDQTILKYMKKAAKVEKYQWAMDELDKRDIVTFASLICGFPGETEQSIMNTINFIEESKPTFFNVQLYYHDTRAPIQQRSAEFAIHGAGYNWKHRSMDWKVAAAWTKYMFNNIKNSIPLGLYGFSLWGIAYLVSKGIPMEKIKAFGKLTRDMLLSSLDDDFSLDYSFHEQQLIDLFRHTSVTQLPLSNINVIQPNKGKHKGLSLQEP